MNLGATRQEAHHEPKQETAMLECADCRRAMPRSVTVLLWISGRADGAHRVHLACVPKSGGRIGELPLVATGRDYIQHAKANITPKNGGRTKSALRVFAARAASTEDVRFIVVPKCG